LRDFVPVEDEELICEHDGRQFPFTLKPVNSVRHIGIDQGPNNFAIVCFDKRMDEPAKLVAAEILNLNLDTNFSATDVFLQLTENSQLWNWMQQCDFRLLSNVDRVIVHLEQMSILNKNAKVFGVQLGQQLQSAVRDFKTCVVKLSSPHLYTTNGPVFKLGKMIVEELNLKPISEIRKRASAVKRPANVPSTGGSTSGVANADKVERSMDTCAELSQTPSRAMSGLTIDTPKKPNSSKCSRVLFSDVEPTDSSPESDVEVPVESTVEQEVDVEVAVEPTESVAEQEMDVEVPAKPALSVAERDGDAQYREKKKMSAAIFRYFMFANEAQQEDLGITVDAAVQALWQKEIVDVPNVKLDDLGDASLHALKALLCPGSMYKELIPSNSGLQVNRTVVVSVRRDFTYYVVMHSSWNLCEIENFGVYESAAFGQYNSPETVITIKSTLVPELRIALTDTTGADMYKPVDHIKMIVKQLKGFQDFKSNQAGTLTQALATTLMLLCDECGGFDSLVIDRKRDSVFGRQYIRTNTVEGKKYQVVWSSGKQTNAMLSCMNWMIENAKSFVQSRTSKAPPDVLKKFFNALQDLACSSENRLESIVISAFSKKKFRESWNMDADTHIVLADLMLIGISKNQNVVKAVAANYRKSSRKPKSGAPDSSSGAQQASSDAPSTSHPVETDDNMDVEG